MTRIPFFCRSLLAGDFTFHRLATFTAWPRSPPDHVLNRPQAGAYLRANPDFLTFL